MSLNKVINLKAGYVSWIIECKSKISNKAEAKIKSWIITAHNYFIF